MVGGVGSMNIDSQSRNMQVKRPSEHGWVIGRSLGFLRKEGTERHEVHGSKAGFRDIGYNFLYNPMSA